MPVSEKGALKTMHHKVLTQWFGTRRIGGRVEDSYKLADKGDEMEGEVV